MSSRSNHGHFWPIILPEMILLKSPKHFHKNLGHFTFALRFFIDRWSFVVTRWSFEVGNDFSLAQQSFTTLVLILLYPCLPVPWSKVSLSPRSNMTMCPWPSRAPWPYVTKSVKKVLDKKSGRLLGMLRIKLKTSRILTSILLSDPVRDQTSIFKVTSCLITSSKTQPKSTESRKFFRWQLNF